MSSFKAAVLKTLNRPKKNQRKSKKKERKKRNKRGGRIYYRLKRRLLGNMCLLDKPFIIFIARKHDEREERNTIRSER